MTHIFAFDLENFYNPFQQSFPLEWPKPKVLIVIIVLGGIAFGPLRYAVSRLAAPLGVGTFLGIAK